MVAGLPIPRFSQGVLADVLVEAAISSIMLRMPETLAIFMPIRERFIVLLFSALPTSARRCGHLRATCRLNRHRPVGVFGHRRSGRFEIPARGCLCAACSGIHMRHHGSMAGGLLALQNPSGAPMGTCSPSPWAAACRDPVGGRNTAPRDRME